MYLYFFCSMLDVIRIRLLTVIVSEYKCGHWVGHMIPRRKLFPGLWLVSWLQSCCLIGWFWKVENSFSVSRRSVAVKYTIYNVWCMVITSFMCTIWSYENRRVNNTQFTCPSAASYICQNKGRVSLVFLKRYLFLLIFKSCWFDHFWNLPPPPPWTVFQGVYGYTSRKNGTLDQSVNSPEKEN